MLSNNLWIIILVIFKIIIITRIKIYKDLIAINSSYFFTISFFFFISLSFIISIKKLKKKNSGISFKYLKFF